MNNCGAKKEVDIELIRKINPLIDWDLIESSNLEIIKLQKYGIEIKKTDYKLMSPFASFTKPIRS